MSEDVEASRGMRTIAVAPTAMGLAPLIGAAFGTSLSELMTAERGPAPIALARQVAMYLAHTRLHLSLTAAGALFGRDRTTAAHACRQIEDRREDRHFDLLIDCLERAIDARPCGWLRR